MICHLLGCGFGFPVSVSMLRVGFGFSCALKPLSIYPCYFSSCCSVNAFSPALYCSFPCQWKYFLMVLPPKEK